MKAIKINGEVKTFSRIPKNWTDENGLHLGIKDGSEYGFKDLATPNYDSRSQELNNLHLEGDVYTYDVVDKTINETLAELKKQKISELKSLVNNKISKTDWYIIRESDSGELTPKSIKDERTALRNESNSIEAQINALTTKKSVVLFDINL
jgi:hypothetical protein